MRKLVIMASMALLALPVSIHAQGQGQGQGGGAQGKGEGKSSAPGKSGSNGPSDKKQAERPGNTGDNRSAQAPGQDRIDGQAKRTSPVPGHEKTKRDVAGVGARPDDRMQPPLHDKRIRDNHIRTVQDGRYIWRDRGFQGCPPGLAKKDNGCLPPGQARKLSGLSDGAMRWHRYSEWFRAGRGDDWRYDRGYAYRVDPGTNLVVSVLPLLGGALIGGNSWPQSSMNYQVTPYYNRYYGYDDAYDYRFADGAVFAVNPETQVIQSIAGLLTGDSWQVGSRMPQGYDLYNVPSDYRSSYADNGSSMYRYNDGYIYEVDPTTQLVRRLIELVV